MKTSRRATSSRSTTWWRSRSSLLAGLRFGSRGYRRARVAVAYDQPALPDGHPPEEHKNARGEVFTKPPRLFLCLSAAAALRCAGAPDFALRRGGDGRAATTGTRVLLPVGSFWRTRAPSPRRAAGSEQLVACAAGMAHFHAAPAGTAPGARHPGRAATVAARGGLSRSRAR